MIVDAPTGSPPRGNILNYSIISSDEEENPLVIKLKVSTSNKNKSPLVVLNGLENANRCNGVSRVNSLSSDGDMNLRSAKLKVKDCDKMGRNQTTPKKRVLDQIDTSNLDNLCMSMTNKVNLNSPIKRPLTQTDFADTDNDASPRKKGPISTTPTRRSSRRLTNLAIARADENEALQFTRSVKRRSCAPLRFEQEFPHAGSVKVNLNNSFRNKAILRSRQNVENIRGDSCRALKSDDSDEDEAIQVVEALKKSEIEVSSVKRVLRLRSSSNVGCKPSTIRRRVLRSVSHSTNPAISTSDSESDLEVTPFKGRRTTQSETSPGRLKSKRALPKTPKTPKNTPKNQPKMLRDGTITPSMHSRTSSIPGDSTPLMKARTQLHVSYVPASLPCREREYLDVYNFLKGKLEDGCGGCMYISGVPGTGKTATVTSVIDNLLNEKHVSRFSYVNVNGMRLTEPRQSYVEIWKQLTGKTVPWEQAQSLLEERFTKKKKFDPVVMLIDELDILCTKRQDVVYNLLDWPMKCKDQLIVITIANTMDLPERLLMSRVTSRLGLTRLTFQAYTHKQLMEIVTKRLIGTESFNSDAVQLVARKVASVSGDARRALDICRRAAEIAETEGQGQLVNIMHINEALTAMITQPTVLAIRRCSRLQKLLLQAIVAEIERTGVEETTFADMFRMLVPCCALDGFKMVSSTTAQRALSQLGACKLALTDQKGGDIYQKVALNVSVHDVYFALKKD